MFRSSKIAIGFALVLCCIANAQPQTMSYFSGACPTTGSCDVVAALPPQGFVLTDIIYGTNDLQYVRLQEVIGGTPFDRTNLVLSMPAGYPQSYHLNSGIPFAGGSTLRAISSGTGGLQVLTFVGYIPNTGCCPSPAPAMGSLGLGVIFIAMLAIGGAIMRRSQLPA